MFTRFVSLVIVLLGFSREITAQQLFQSTQWGAENTSCAKLDGQGGFLPAVYVAQLGSGAPVHVYKLAGNIAVGALTGASQSPPYEHQVMVRIYGNVGHAPYPPATNAFAVSNPPGSNSALNNSIYKFGARQLGVWPIAPTPVDLDLTAFPALLPDGRLMIDFTTIAATSQQPPPSTECLDTDIQVTIIWSN